MAELCAEFAFTKVYYLGRGLQGSGSDSRSRLKYSEEILNDSKYNYSIKYFDIYGRLILEGDDLNSTVIPSGIYLRSEYNGNSLIKTRKIFVGQ